MAAVWFKAGNHQTVLFQPCFFLVTCILWHAEFCCNIYCDLSPCWTMDQESFRLMAGCCQLVCILFIYLQMFHSLSESDCSPSKSTYLQAVAAYLLSGECAMAFQSKWSRVLQLGPMLYQFFLPTASLNWSDSHFHKNCPSALTLKGNLHFQFVSHLFQLYCCLVSS